MNDQYKSFLDSFHNFLLSQKNPPSVLTVKNYKADIRQFFSWFEAVFKRPLSTQDVTQFVIDQYIKEKSGRDKLNIKTDKTAYSNGIQGLSLRTLERHLSSIRKFLVFLGSRNAHIISPKLTFSSDTKEKSDKFDIKHYKNYLYEHDLSALTIKNYINDLNHFLHWIEQVTGVNHAWDAKNQNPLAYINNTLLEEYKTRLLSYARLSPVSINRKLSSLRKYIEWGISKGIINNHIVAFPLGNKPYESSLIQASSLLAQITSGRSGSHQKKWFDPIKVNQNNINRNNYSWFPPLRLVQKIVKGCFLFSDKTIGSIDLLLLMPVVVVNTVSRLTFLFWGTKEKHLFYQSSTNSEKVPKQTYSFNNYPKALYDPLGVSMRNQSLYQKIWINLVYNRPKWYKKYHSYPLVHHFHFALLVLIASLFGLILSDGLFGSKQQKAILGIATPLNTRTLVFRGKLTDALNNPINYRQLRFSLYNDEMASGSAMLWQEIQTVLPDNDGNFSVTLGSLSKLSDQLFTEQSLWLGVTVGSNPELVPRKQISTISLSRDTESLQGMVPITQPGAPAQNAILALDSSGNLSIGGSANPVFQATGGQLTLSGESIVVTTNQGSDKDVIINPDGLGQIDLQKPIHNTSNYNTIPEATGSVEVDDTLFVLATTSAQSAFTINQNSSGPLISASTSGIAKFVVNNFGDGFFAGKLGVGNSSPSAALDVVSNAGEQLRLSYSPSRYGAFSVNPIGDFSIEASGGDISSLNRLTLGAILPGPSKLNIFGSEPGNALVTFNQTGQDAIIAASSSGVTKFLLDQNGSISLALGALIKPLSDGTSALAIATSQGTAIASFDTVNSRMGIGTTSPSQALEVNGAVRLNLPGAQTINGLCHSGTGTTGQDIVDCSGTPSDLAEWYGVTPDVETGDIVSTSKDMFVYDSQGADPFTGRVKSLGTQRIAILKKAASNESPIGIISTGPYQIIGEDVKQAIERSSSKEIKPLPVALKGRVPVKISLENGPIEPGDFLTLSHTAGVAMKAKEPGIVIGQALEEAKDPSTNKILVFVDVSWHDPTMVLAANGTLTVSKNPDNQEFGLIQVAPTEQAKSITQQAQETTTTTITRVGAFANAAIANLEAGRVNSFEVITKSLSVTTGDLKIAGMTIKEYLRQVTSETLDRSLQAAISLMAKEKIVSPLVESDQIAVRIISPLASDAVTISARTIIQEHANATSSSQPLFEVQNASSSAVATIDREGNATFSGSLRGESLLVDESLSAKQASIEGTLRAGKLVADDVAFSDNALSRLRGSLGNGASTTPSLQTATNSALPSSIDASYGRFSEGIIALGPTSLTNLSVSEQLSISTHLFLADNAINALGSDLEIQPLKQSNISFMSGGVVIDTDGNLKVQGNAVFANDASILGTLSPHIISPIPGSDLVLRLDNDTSQISSQSANFVIKNASDAAILSVNQKGDLIASGSGSFSDIITNSLTLVRSVQADTSMTETIATASAGTATIIIGERERTITTPFVKEKSLIYLSPASDTKGTTPYIARQTPQAPIDDSQPKTKGSFTIQIPKPATQDITVNWWIVN